jgi:hypothetical protein
MSYLIGFEATLLNTGMSCCLPLLERAEHGEGSSGQPSYQEANAGPGSQSLSSHLYLGVCLIGGDGGLQGYSKLAVEMLRF